MSIDIHGDPPTRERLAEYLATERADRADDDIAPKVALYAPPLVDVVVALGVAAAEHAFKGEPGAQWREVRGSAARDWGASGAVAEYVAKVRAMGRDLVGAEIEAIESHAAVLRRVDYAASTAKEIALGGLKRYLAT